MVQTMQTIFWLKPPKQQMKHTVPNVSKKKYRSNNYWRNMDSMIPQTSERQILVCYQPCMEHLTSMFNPLSTQGNLFTLDKSVEFCFVKCMIADS
jgi:hypothetical protein